MFSIAAAIHFHKLCSFNNTRSASSIRRSEIQHGAHWAYTEVSVMLPEVLGGKLFVALSASSSGPWSLAHGPLVRLQSQRHCISEPPPLPPLSLTTAGKASLISRTHVIPLDPPGSPRIIAPSQGPQLKHACKVPSATSGHVHSDSGD